MSRVRINIYKKKKRIVRQVGYLQELKRDARSTKHYVQEVSVDNCFIPCHFSPVKHNGNTNLESKWADLTLARPCIVIQFK